MPRDNQGESPATIRMRIFWGWGYPHPQKIFAPAGAPLAVAMVRVWFGFSQSHEELDLARAPHHRLPNEVLHEVPSDGDTADFGGQVRL